MTNNLDEKGIHDGHRRRMKDKLLTHGRRIFDTYELVEMLLYHVIPYRDTNPVAKRLLAAFGSLDGVFSATKEELTDVNGIGERAADLILTVGDMLSAGELSRHGRAVRVFDDYDETGEYLVNYFSDNDGLTVAALMLDGGMRLVGRVNVFNTDLASAGVRSKHFIDEAMLAGASVAILAHTRPHSALFPTFEDRATVKMIVSDLAAVGVRVVEHYIVSETRYLGVSERMFFRLSSDAPELERFIRSRDRRRG